MTEVGHSKPVQPGTLIVTTVALMAMGLVMVTSAAASLDHSHIDRPLWQTTFGRQAVFVFVGLSLVVLTRYAAGPFLARRAARRWIPHGVFALALIGLAAAFLPGWADVRHGSHRWLQFSPTWTGIGFQPSELAKLALIGFLGAWFAEHGFKARSFGRGFFPAVLAIGVCVLLVGTEDFSTAVLLAGVGFLMLFVAGCRLLHLLITGVLGGAGLGALLFTTPYRMARLTAFQNLWDRPLDEAYQPLQSLAAIASGGWLGTGLGAGVQKYGYLPESHSDFVFAVICEETGVLGGGLVIALFCVLVWFGLRTMWSAPTRFERLLSFGITTCLGLQAAMNIAVVTVVAPTTGIPLPLVSAGGSGLITFSLAIGLLAAVAARGGERASCAVGLPEDDEPGPVAFGQQGEFAW